MQKKTISIAVIITSFFIFIIAFCIRTINMSQLSSYAIHNYDTDNVYILQINKKLNSILLYRKQEDQSLLRYSIINDMVQADTTQNGKWKPGTGFQLPASPFTLIAEFCDLLKERNESTTVIKMYADFLLTAFSTVYDDSVILIDYDQLPCTVQEIKELLKNKSIQKSISFKRTTDFSKCIFSFSPFISPDANERFATIISTAIQSQYREIIFASLIQSFEAMKNYKILITTSLTGNLYGIDIFKNNECIFTVYKLK